MSSTSPDIQKVVKVIQAILNRFRVSESQIYRSEQLQSDISIDNYLKLLIRHIEGILYLGSKDIFLLPPALSLARTVIETCANTLWLLNPEDPWEREIHLIALLKEEIKGYKEYIKNPNNYKEDISMSGKDSILIQEYINNIKGNIPPHYEEIQYLNFRGLLSSLKLYKIYPTYCILSKFTQGTHSATCLYKRALDEDTVFREPIEIKNGTLPYILLVRN
ncbi:hypothetical protein [Trichormus azollae]|jgi:hypothetical protein|uniref:Uncharacterized protein n=1 Tax=Nostoc azollae (strain 0708) TaxID=551115 RepID=D7E3F4_NOSA0|nr:hypothetical protein [Trichormus azollae]ADI63577.1 hypothetical protein Aazo_1302 ['Nostoc azollae' 0708]